MCISAEGVESGGSRLSYPDNTYTAYDYDELNRMTVVRLGLV